MRRVAGHPCLEHHDVMDGYEVTHASLMSTYTTTVAGTETALSVGMRLKPCIWGGCNGTRGPDGRCNRCGSKRP
jgi:hypothetical protein